MPLRFPWLEWILDGELSAWWHDRPPLLRWVIAVGGLALFAAASLPLSSATYRALKQATMDRHLRAAQAALESGDHQKASDLAWIVARARDPDPAVLRVLEQAMDALGDDRRSAVSQALYGHPEATPDDRLRIFERSARDDPFGVVQRNLEALPPAERMSRGIAMALAGRALDDQLFSDALKRLADLPTEPPDPEVAALRIRAWTGIGSIQSHALAQKRIVFFLQRNPADATWHHLLESIPIRRLDPYILRPIRSIAAVPGHPGLSELIETRIRWSMAESTGAADRIVADAVAQWRHMAPEALARFLQAACKDELFVETFTHESVAGNPPLIIARCETLLRLGRYGEAAATLHAHEASLPELDFLALATLASHRGGDFTRKAELWQRALAAAAKPNHPRALLELHQRLFRGRLIPEAEEALLKAIQRGRGPLPSSLAIQRLTESLVHQQRENDLLAVFASYLRLEPNQPEVVCQYCQLAAFTGREPLPELIAQMTHLHQAHPHHNLTTAVLATLHVLAGKTAEAAATWSALTLPPSDLEPTARTAYLVTQALSGQIPARSPDFKSIPWNRLLPSARKALQGLIASHGD